MIRPADAHDLPTLAALACLLWDSHKPKKLEQEFSALLSSDQAQLFMAFSHNTPVGFAQCQLRHDYVEGTDSSPVGYLEGVFVLPSYRRQGYAKALISACEDWARQCGCRQFASDCELDNTDSLAFHLSIGFTEANRIICFTKDL